MIDVTGMPQTAVVVGGSSDIAQETLRRLARRRLKRVLLVGRSVGPLDQVAAELRNLNCEVALTLPLDVVRPETPAEITAAAESSLGEIDLLLLAAGDLGTAELDNLDAAEVSRLLAVNFTGQAAIGFAVSEVMRRRGSGHIVVISSAAGVRVRRSNFVYGAAKAGLDGFFHGLADSLHDSGVRVTVVRPGFVRTKMTAGMREPPIAVDAAAVAEAVVDSLGSGGRTVWVPSILRPVFAILRVVPQPLWRRLPF